MDRKRCADCGEPNLDSEWRCWACGGVRFAPPGAAPDDEPTISLGYASDRTVSWSPDRRIPPRAYYVAGGAALGLLMALVGYWIGRATTAGASPQTPPAVASRPVALPAPSPGMIPQTPAFSAPPEPPIVTVRSTTARNAPLAAPGNLPESAKQPAAPPGPVVYPVPRGSVEQPSPPAPAPQPAPARAASGPRIVSQVRRVATPAAAPVAPAGEPPLPAPTRSTSVVALRNDASTAVEVKVDGDGTRTAWIPPGGTVPLNLSPGSYQLRASSHGAASAQSTLSLAPNRTYALLVNRMREDGKDILVLIEPLEPGADGG